MTARGVNDIYEFYINSLDIKVRELTSHIENCIESISYYKTKLVKYKDYIDKYCNIPYGQIFSKDVIKKVVRFSNEDIAKNALIKRYISGYLKSINNRNDLIKKRKEVKSLYVSNNVFSTILTELNNNKIKLAITENIRIGLGRAGKIYLRYVSPDENKAKPIDWKASNKLKQEIIDRGGTPFEQYTDENGAICGNNGGEKWFVRHTTNKRFMIKWDDTNVTNKSAYKFKPSSYKNDKVTVENVLDNYSKEEVLDADIGFVNKLNVYHVVDPLAYFKFI